MRGLKLVRVRGLAIDSLNTEGTKPAGSELGSSVGSTALMAEKSFMLRRDASMKKDAFLLIGPPKLPSNITEL